MAVGVADDRALTIPGLACVVEPTRKTTKKPARKPEAERRKIFLIDDHAVLRDGLRRLLGDQDDMILAGEAENARKAFAKLETLEPDLVVVDISMPGSNGIELIKSLKARFPKLAVIVLSMHDEALYAERALRAGARGYIMKQASAEHLLAAIRTVLRGEIHLSQDLSSALLKSIVSQRQQTVNSLDRLSDRELEIFRLLGEGYTTREIATSLSISAKTVESHRGNIRQKLKLSSGAELMRFAMANRDEGT
jgi:DNA-binding NarL/FixJ family response regulator